MLVTGKVGGKSAEVLRGTGCIIVIIKRDLVSQDQLCGMHGYAMAFDRSVIRAPIAKIRVDTPYYVGKENALCFREPICELIIRNIPGARELDDPNPTWGYVARTQEQETQTMKMDIAEDLEAEEEWCELREKENNGTLKQMSTKIMLWIVQRMRRRIPVPRLGEPLMRDV